MKTVNSMVCLVKLDVLESGSELKIRRYTMTND